jgi:Protein of unknown function, DUF547
MLHHAALIWIVMLAADATTGTLSPAPVPGSIQTPVLIQDDMHVGLDSLLQRYVSTDGKVNYRGLKAEQAALTAYLQVLSDHVPTDNTDRSVALAYWINAYNAFTLDLIVRNYPTKSIMRFDGGKTWDVRRIVLGGKKYSLNQIENDIIRPKFKDPRIHFAVNCAARSCPPLHNRAFTATNLEVILDARTRLFINNPAYNSINGTTVRVSKIFEWYAVDFGDLRNFLNKYADKPVKRGASIVFQEYNWDLNE